MLALVRCEPNTHAEPVAIAAGEVHVWAFALDEPEAIVEAWGQLLSTDERLRADRLVFRRDRNRWIVARGTLRHLLARYCGIHPRAIAFHYACAGKPSISLGGSPGELIKFNLAHSHDRALLGVAQDRELGVDLERARHDFDPLPIARQFFFGAELAAIEAAPPSSRREAFFRHWVAKEAILKANGVGLSLALDSFGVTFEPGDSIARVQSTDPGAVDETLVVRMLPLAAEWHGAIATSGDGWTLRFPG
jgi:4'-phosphopantetheinyl transferase